MDLVTPRESPAKLRKKSAIRDNHEKNWIPHVCTIFDNCSVELLKARVLWASVAWAFNKYVTNALTHKGTKQETVVLLLDLLEFVAGVNRVTSLIPQRHAQTISNQCRQCD